MGDAELFTEGYGEDIGGPVCTNVFITDCHGIPFRFVCYECYDKLMEKGYDGQYYTELDEQIEPDY